jgi:phosphate transport system substrate-binding protein
MYAQTEREHITEEGIMKQVRRLTRVNRALAAVLSGLLMAGVLACVAGETNAEQAGAATRPVVDAGLPSYVSVNGLSGRLTVAGSDTMQPLMATMAAVFRHLQPEVKIVVEGGGSKAAWTEFLNTHAQARRGNGNPGGHLGSYNVMLMASSQELREDELKTFVARNGYEPTAIPIAVDAVAIYAHHDSLLPGLTLEQVDALFSKTRKRGLQEITIWGQLGLSNGWETLPVRLHGRNKMSGTHEVFKANALLGGEFKDAVEEEPGSASVVLAVARDLYAIGYSGMGYQTSLVQALPLAEKAGMPFVTPSAESATNGTYPLSRRLYLYVNKAPNAEWNPVLLEFMKFVNSREGQTTVVRANAYPLPPAQVAKNLRILTGSATTTDQLAAERR